MMRGTFANIRIRNQMAPGTEGGVTKHQPSGRKMSIYDAAVAYAKKRRWLCSLAELRHRLKPRLGGKRHTPLGVRAVIAESFERIHRSNLVGMGVAPLQFTGNASWEKLKLDGTETISIKGLEGKLKPRQKLDMVITRANGRKQTVKLQSRIDTQGSRIFPKWRYFAVCPAPACRLKRAAQGF